MGKKKKKRCYYTTPGRKRNSNNIVMMLELCHQRVLQESTRWERLSRCALRGRLAKMTVTEGQRRLCLFYNTQ